MLNALLALSVLHLAAGLFLCHSVLDTESMTGTAVWIPAFTGMRVASRIICPELANQDSGIENYTFLFTLSEDTILKKFV